MIRKRSTNIVQPVLNKPVISGSVDVWGDILNENIDKTIQFNSQLIADSENQNQELARLEREKVSKTDVPDIVEPIINEFVESQVKPTIDNYIDTVSKPAITQHAENKKQEINNYVDTVSKPNLDSYEKEKESELDVHTQKNKDILDTYTISKQSQLDSYEKTKEVQIDEYTNTKYPQLDEYTNIKEKELDGHTETKKKQLDDYTSKKEEVLSSHVEDIKGVIDSYEKIKENELDDFTGIKKNEITSHTDSKKTELDEYAKEVHNTIIGYSDEQLIKFKQQATEESDNQIVKVVEETDKQILRVIEEGDKQIQLISGLTDDLSSRVENLENNKLDNGGYDGTAQDLKTLIDSKSTVSLSDNIPLQNEGSGKAGISETASRSDHSHPLQTTVSGNAGTSTKLQTARAINGTNFDGSANITTANWGTARTLTIGNSAKSVNGSSDVSWTLSEIGALSSTTATTWNATGTTSGQGLTFYGKTVVGGTNDGWVRLNAHNQFSSGIYCGSTGVLRHDSEITAGSSGADGTTRIRSGVYDSTWGGNGVAHFSAHDTDSSGAHWLLASYYDSSNIRAGIQVLTSSTGDMRLYTNRRSNYVTISGGNVLAGSSQNTSSNALTRKDYVDGQIATKLSTSGGTISGNLTVTGAIVSNGNVTAYSDRRLKTDITRITNALEKVNKISGYTFTMLGTGKRQAGVIAQEIEQVLPEVVVKNEDNDYLTVMYGHIVALLIEAMKEMSKEIEELKGGR